MKAAAALIAWNIGPDGGIGIGPLLTSKYEADWTEPYDLTGGAAYSARREMSGTEQRLAVMMDWRQLVFDYGLHPYLVHLAFLRIDEYQEVLKEGGWGPDKGEFGHDPTVEYGRAVEWPLPPIETAEVGRSFHFWLRGSAPPTSDLGRLGGLGGA
jgi:hypothetical protein